MKPGAALIAIVLGALAAPVLLGVVLLRFLGDSSDIKWGIEVAVDLAAAFVIAALTAVLVYIEILRDRRADQLETAVLRVVAGRWSGDGADLYVVNSGWKASAIEEAWILFKHQAGGGARFQLQLTRFYAQNDARYDVLIQPGERVRLRGNPLQYRAEQVHPEHKWQVVTLKPVLGETTEVDLKDPEFPAE